MDEEQNQPSLRDRIHSVATVIGTGEGYQGRLDLLVEQLRQLNCFDDDPDFPVEFRGVISKEIRNGAEKVGIIGSRADGTQQPNKSDLDVVTINPKVSKNSSSKGLQVVEYAGKMNYWDSKTSGMTPLPRIHINRYPREDDRSKPIVRRAVWVWIKESGPLNKTAGHR